MAAKDEVREVEAVAEDIAPVAEEAPVEEAPVEEAPAVEEAPVESEAPKKSKPKKTTFKVQVQVIFRDINTGELRKPGDVIEVSQKRFDEINSKRVHVKRI